MSQNLATYSIGQMPNITSPDLFNIKALRELATNRLNQPANPLAKLQLLDIKLSGPAVLGRHRELKSLSLEKFLFKRLRQISPVSQKQTAITTAQFSNHLDIMNIGWGEIKGLNHTDRVNLYMELKAVKSLITQFFAVACYAFEEFGISGSSEAAYWYGKAVNNSNCITKSTGYVFKQTLLDCPDVSGLTNVTYTRGKLWKVVSVESFEKLEDFFVGLKAKKFADDFHRKYFTVSQLWRWASLSESSFWEILFHKIVYFAEDIYDKIIKVHFFALHWLKELRFF